MFKPAIYWVSRLERYRLALMPRPIGGEWLADEIAGWRDAGIDSVVSLLEQQEIHELELEKEELLCNALGIYFRSFPIQDRGTPSSIQDVSSLLGELYTELIAGRGVAIHCRAGIGRTGLITGCLLHVLGVPHHEIFPLLSQARGVPVPDTPEQETWLKHFVQTHSPSS